MLTPPPTLPLSQTPSLTLNFSISFSSVKMRLSTLAHPSCPLSSVNAVVHIFLPSYTMSHLCHTIVLSLPFPPDGTRIEFVCGNIFPPLLISHLDSPISLFSPFSPLFPQSPSTHTIYWLNRSFLFSPYLTLLTTFHLLLIPPIWQSSPLPLFISIYLMPGLI